MFLFILTYKKPLEETKKYLDAHHAYLDKYYKAGKFILSGRRDQRVGGLSLLNAKDKNEAIELMQEDPFFIYDIATFELIEFEPTKYAEEFEQFIVK